MILAENFPNKSIYTQTSNPGAKSDIARYDILFRYGGVYADVDLNVLNPLISLMSIVLSVD